MNGSEASKEVAKILGTRDDGPGADEAVVTYHGVVCRDGDMATEMYLGRDGEAAVYGLQHQHYEVTGHQRYWHFTVQRSTARIVDPAKGKW